LLLKDYVRLPCFDKNKPIAFEAAQWRPGTFLIDLLQKLFRTWKVLIYQGSFLPKMPFAEGLMNKWNYIKSIAPDKYKLAIEELATGLLG
jgi:hypothetical protein